ncbi:MAG: hypothetical protein ABSE89_08990 [Sedimentisphaerales bacterium]
MEQKQLFPDTASKKIAEQTFKNYFEDFSDCIQHGGWSKWEDILRKAPDACKSLRSSTIASIIFDNTIERMRKIFKKYEPEVIIYDDKILGFPVLDFRGKFLVRFKKLRDDFKPSNVKTDRQKGLNQQLLTSDGIPWVSDGATWVTVGYRLNQKEDKIKDISIVCWKGESLDWHIELPLLQSSISEQPVNLKTTKIKLKAQTQQKRKKA